MNRDEIRRIDKKCDDAFGIDRECPCCGGWVSPALESCMCGKCDDEDIVFFFCLTCRYQEAVL